MILLLIYLRKQSDFKMSSEYVRFFGKEALYGEKYLLTAELGILGFVKRLRNYKKLRQEEMILKIALKKKIDEVGEQLDIFDKLLPHTKMAGLIKKPAPREASFEDKEALTLEQEVERIRRKLELLREI